MKVSLNWLNQYVKVDDLDPKELADRLTFAGVEVESVSRLAQADKLVIGRIVSCEKHPDSDHLHVLQVNEGSKYGLHQIVCGAPNARTGLSVIVAREGSALPGGVIEKSTIRGVESDGMCCALYELGVDKKYLSEKQLAGIEELPEDAPIGEENVLHYLGLDDVVLDLKLLANRPDLNAMENVAREVGTLYGREVSFPSAKAIHLAKTAFSVASKTEKCPQFAIREIRGVSSRPSPEWLKKILASEGIRSVDAIVDIGNYVMLLTGQPLNMYDLDKLPKPELTVIDDYKGEFLAMDGKSYALCPGDLVVASASAPMCLAGIMTSAEAAIGPSTKNLAVESAVFNYASIRRTSARLGLTSESSNRFAKGINQNQSEEVLNLASALLVELAGASSVGESKNYDIIDHRPTVISTDLAYLNGRLGTAFSSKQIADVLRADHLEVDEKPNGGFDVIVPSHRIDMTCDADVSEEVIRILGYENVVSKLPRCELSANGLNERQAAKRAVRKLLRDAGVSEVLTYSLVGKEQKDAFAYLEQGENYLISNPMTDDHKYLRKNLLWSLVDTAAYNVARQNKDVALFEVSDVDAPGVSSSHLAIIEVGSESLRGSLEKRPYGYYSVKGLFAAIMSLLGIGESRYKIFPLDSAKGEFHPGRSAAIVIGRRTVGVFGELHPDALKKYGLGKTSSAALEIDLDAFVSLRTSPIKASIPPKFPSVSRDLAFVCDKAVSYEDIKREIAHSDKLIVAVEVFDVYEGENIQADKKSIALTVTLSDPEKTLKDEESNAVIEKIIGVLKTSFNAEIRQ